MSNFRSVFLFCCFLLFGGCRNSSVTIRQTCTTINRAPRISPDYSGITIPSNIAPLNFTLMDSCVNSFAEFTSKNGSPLTVWGEKGVFRINDNSWKRLLSENAGNPLHVTIYVRDTPGRWHRYPTIENFIAAEPIDHYCTYRLLHFQYSYWKDLRICQRDLTSFTETDLVNTMNYTPDDALKCVNCHMPMNNDPSRFVLQLRSKTGGVETLIAEGDTITTLSSKLGHASWHPDGGCIAFSAYNVRQNFHTVGRQFIDVYDNNSGIVIYDIVKRKTVPVPALDQSGMLETWPAWSADGRYLYFCSAPLLWSDHTIRRPPGFNKTRYSLMRIGYDVASKSWGDPDTVLSTVETGLSIALPRISPDNRFCLFCMQDYGPYPYIDASSDLYLMDIAIGNYRKLPVNSDYNESWHSWSANSRWILFSSRRGGGIFTRLYISYIDSAGNAGKPFVLPQRDPTFYDSFLKCYNVAEFAVAPVRFSERQLLKSIRSRQTVSVPLPPNTPMGSGKTSQESWMSIDNQK